MARQSAPASFFWTGVPFFEKMDVEHMQGEIAVLRTCVACAGHLRPGALWIPVDDVTQKPRAPWISTLYGPPMARHDVPAAPPTSPPGEHAFFPGFFAAAELSARLADHSWVEVMRIARVDDKREEGDRCLESAPSCGADIQAIRNLFRLGETSFACASSARPSGVRCGCPPRAATVARRSAGAPGA